MRPTTAARRSPEGRSDGSARQEAQRTWETCDAAQSAGAGRGTSSAPDGTTIHVARCRCPTPRLLPRSRRRRKVGSRTFDKAVRMRSVRCDACGTKALIAASQCPKCGHLFEMRDGSGDPLPLAHCPSCDSYYPAHVHSCKWCGTTLTPEKIRRGNSLSGKWIAAAAFIAAVWLGSHVRDPRPKVATRQRASTQPAPKAVARAAQVTASAPADTVKPHDPTDAAGNVVLSDVAVPVTSTPASPGYGATPQPAASATTASAPVATPNPAAPRTVPTNPRSSSPWVGMVARGWVIVRADAQGSARIVASVGPDSRVQLGESRGSWRRIRARGIAGWVDVSRASFVPIRSSPRRVRGVAER